MKNLGNILKVIGQVAKYAGFLMVVYDTIIFVKERLEKEVQKQGLTEDTKK